MRPNDYYGNYKAFVKSLSENPELTLKEYCESQNVIWHSLYDWMHRHKISLKRLYDAYRKGSDSPVPSVDKEMPSFCEIVPSEVGHRIRPAAEHTGSIIGMSRLLLPTGVVIELKDCPVSALSVLLGQCMGKEVSASLLFSLGMRPAGDGGAYYFMLNRRLSAD